MFIKVFHSASYGMEKVDALFQGLDEQRKNKQN